MGRTVALRAETTEDNGLVTSCQRGSARAALRVELDASGVSRKALAHDVCHGDESLLSKKVAGAPGRTFDLDDLDALPRPVLVKWLQRYGHAMGLRVTEIEPGEVTERLLMLVDELATAAKLARIVSGKPLKAKLRE